MEGNRAWLPDPSTWKSTWREDWRLMGQEGYLTGKRLQHRRFRRELCRQDYDQCDFCWTGFETDDGLPVLAYYVPEEQLWICETCYKDFQHYFKWVVEEFND